jgi:2,3-bisphosphoglycerate-dependent phosphoglycerate mutase
LSILIVRHGETDFNAARIVQLRDTPLSVRGVRQAERVAGRLAELGVAHVIASDLTRAVMTARCIADRTGAPVVYDARLRERDFGDVCGTPYADLTTDIFGPDYEPPGGETWETFFARVASAWERVTQLAAATQGNLVVVTHGLVCHAVADRHARCADTVPSRWHNTSVTEVDGTPPWTARLVNCIAHLSDDTDGDESSGAV